MDIELINSREFAKRVVNYKNDRLIQSELQAIHYELFKKNFRVNCGSCIKQAYVNIREKINMVITNQTKKQMGLFELKKSSTGISKQIHIDHDIITNDNLTDEIAIKILKKIPSHIVTFHRYPANWRDIVFGKVAETKKENFPEEKQSEPLTTFARSKNKKQKK